jgi:hypothetical protein
MNIDPRTEDALRLLVLISEKIISAGQTPCDEHDRSFFEAYELSKIAIARFSEPDPVYRQFGTAGTRESV